MQKDRRAAKNFTNRLEDLAEVGMADEYATDSGASLTYPVQSSALRRNGFVILKGNTCKIVEMSTSKTGKHGHAKVHLIGLDIFTGKKYEELCPSSHSMHVPIVTRKEYIVTYLSRDGFLSLMNDAGIIRSDFQVADDGEMKTRIMETLNKQEDMDVVVTLLKAMDKEVIMNVVVK